MQTPLASPRIITVDVLRGFALFGILLAHMIFWYSAGPLPGDLFNKYKDIGSQVMPVINDIFISGKFFAFFSFLFGLSFYLQMQRMEKRNDTFVLRYAWRITLLGLIGMVHHAFWRGDILSIYAPLGFLLLPMRKWNNRVIIVLGILFALNVPGKLIEVVKFLSTAAPTPPPPVNGPPPDFEAVGKAYFTLMQQPYWWPLFKANLLNFPDKFKFQLDSGRIFVTFGFFLLGMYTGRKNWFENPDSSRPVFTKILRTCGWLGLGCLLAGLSLIAANTFLKLGWEQKPVMGFIFSIFYDTLSASLVCFYVSGISLLLYRPRWQKRLYPLASVGKMALSCYLTQTLLGLGLYYGVGLGLVGQTTPWLNWLIALAFFVVQVILCKWWLKNFRYGPFEWFWRSATFFQWYPLKRK
jgi:uncharacterized protein